MSMFKHIGTKKKRAQKEYECAWCQKPIHVGENYEILTIGVIPEGKDRHFFGRARIHGPHHRVKIGNTTYCCEVMYDAVNGDDNPELRDHLMNYFTKEF